FLVRRSEQTSAITVLEDSLREDGQGTKEVEKALGMNEVEKAPENGTTGFDIMEICSNLFEHNCGIFSRQTDPFRKERVAEILRLVKRGDDLTLDQNEAVTRLIEQWADIFALSVSKVLPVKGAVHTLDIPSNATFSKKVHQKPLTPPQKRFLHERIDKMLLAGIIKRCKPGQVKCVSGTTLVQKAHQGLGLSLNELQHWVNNQCVANGFKAYFPMPNQCDPTPINETDNGTPKWRICQNFAEINKITKVAPMPQGDIRTKQQNLSGKQ
ncbi:hypothetical protein C0991_006358, partial [Blastosporella zonata]